MITRRRFLSIAAGAGLAAMADSPLRAAASTSPLYRWQGMALGAKTSIVIAREDAPSLIEKARAGEVATAELVDRPCCSCSHVDRRATSTERTSL